MKAGVVKVLSGYLVTIDYIQADIRSLSYYTGSAVFTAAQVFANNSVESKRKKKDKCVPLS